MAELRRRHVGRVAIAYAAVAFVILQAAEIVLPAFDQPDWVLRLVVVFTLLGFPVGLALAWIYDVTPHGIERTASEEAPHGADVGVMPRLALLAITLLIAGGSGWWFVRTTLTEAAGTPESAAGPVDAAVAPVAYEPGAPITSLAVLPLQDFSEGGGQEYFAAGMHEALLAALSQLDGVRVVSRTTANQYESTSKTLPQIARELQVEGVVEGSVLRAGDRVRIAVQLIHGPSDTHVWSRSYEEELSDILRLQREVAADIASQVRDELNADAAAAAVAMATAPPEAHDLFMKGRFEQAKGTPEGLRAAARYFEAATDADPSFAQAYAALSSTLLLLTEQASPVEADLSGVEEAASRALELDGELPEAIAVMTAMVPSSPTDPTPARAIEGERREAWVGALRGIGGEAAIIPILERAMARGQVPVSRQVEMAHVLVASGHPDRAVRILERAVGQAPEALPAWSALERAHTAAGDYAGAVEVRMSRMAHAEGRSDDDLRSLEGAFESGGAEGYWEWCRADMERRLESGEPVGPADLATVYAALGIEDQALAWLQRAVEARDPGLVALRADPVWDPYRDEPRFREIVRRSRRDGPGP